MKPKYCFILLCTIVLLHPYLSAQTLQWLQLPNQDQLPSPRVHCIVQDEEGFLWYAMEGGGICCDDGRQMTVFRNDARHPDLLGSNNVASLAATGRHIIIGTFHGAYVLDKSDYNIRHLSDVDDKRVDDVMVTKDEHWWITANKKVFEFSSDGQLLNTYPAGDKYIFRLHQDCNGRIWASQWQGGLLQLSDGRLQPAPWPLKVAPTNIADNPSGEGLLISTFGMGTVLYQPNLTSDPVSTPVSMPFHQSLSLSHKRFDNNGRLLVADGMGDCFVLATASQQPWYQAQPSSPFLADSLRTARGLSQRPAAFAFDSTGRLWFSTGQDIRRQQQPFAPEEVVLPDLADIAAMTFAADGTLWLGSIYGVIHTFKEGNLSIDDYASNEYGDALLALQTDSLQRMLLVFERYVRLYDPQQHTLRQQSREAPGTYVIELSETRPYQRWSQPESNMVVERLPRWLTAWWMCLIYLIIAALLLALTIHYYILRKQRRRFLDSIREAVREEPLSPQASYPSTQVEAAPPLSAEEQWLQKAIALVMNHIDKDEYGVEQLCNDLAVSRMTFYRKIQSATGQKPSEFIRTIRLHRAAELLREGRLSVTEVSYDTGFSSVSYFSRCFRTMYGVPPTQFGKTTTADDRRPKDIPN